MAFNFNWSPLTADSLFYSRARELLTTALNKSPKPAIIVDDILVNELNLGSVPPDLEILEIGDLAEDRFRGIFKMCYTGDAFLTLKTRVQANPLNTYLSTKPSFASPQPLAAASGLTIPLQITLSEIKLSAIIILVFSRQKGLTLVFRNDPLESLKVSSTFDSIPFVRDYLQKEIEGQLRVLLMDELPAIIHRLSLRLWVPEFRPRVDEAISRNGAGATQSEKPVDPLASPPQDPVDSSGNPLGPTDISNLSLESGTETRPLFSQKNLLRLATLTDSHRTLSLFTPSIRDAVFRAWAGPTEHPESLGLHAAVATVPSLSRVNSSTGSTVTAPASLDGSGFGSPLSRQSSTSHFTGTTGLSMGASRHSRAHGHRKKKHRVVNLRRSKTGSEGGSTDTVSVTSTASTATGSNGPPTPSASTDREGELVTPPGSPEHVMKPQRLSDIDDTAESSKLHLPVSRSEQKARAPLKGLYADGSLGQEKPLEPAPAYSPPARPKLEPLHLHSYPQEKPRFAPASPSALHQSMTLQDSESSAAGILEQAFMVKMATEMARKAHKEKSVAASPWPSNQRDDSPPPAYGS